MRNLDGNQVFHYVGPGGFSHNAGELSVRIAGPDSIVAADVNGDGHADFSILVANVHGLQELDFML